MLEQVAISEETEENPPAKKKRGYNRRNGDQPKTTPTPAFDEKGAITLTPEQASKLWEVITGGRLEIVNIIGGQVVCRVSLDSFNKALPVLLERL